MAEGVKIRCPYCTKIFMVKPETLRFAPDVESKTLRCPYCKEQVVIKREMIAKIMSQQ